MKQKGLLIYVLICFSSMYFSSCDNIKPAEEKKIADNSSKKPAKVINSDTHFKTECRETNSPISLESAVSDTNIIIYRQENIGKLVTLSTSISNPMVCGISLQNNSKNNLLAMISSEAVTSSNSYLLIDFDNDIFTNTDYYYTNGMAVSVILPAFQHFGFTNTLPGLGKNSINYYKIGVRQNMYTGINPETITIDYGDRPFSGVLYLEFSKISNQFEQKTRLSTSIQTGVLGSISLASSLQSGLHDLHPIGWNYQIHNDLIINFSTTIEKGIISTKKFEINAGATGRIGTLNTDISAYAMMRIGKFIPYFKSLSTAKKGTAEYFEENKMQYWISIQLGQQFVFYNATLNGGLFVKDSPYTLTYNDLHHNITQFKAGLNFFYKQNGIMLNFVHIGPEFMKGRYHRWGGISLIRNF